MKRFPLFVCAAALPCLAADFINLTLDDPDLSGPLAPTFPGGPLAGDTSALLRGWTLTADDNPVAQMTYSPNPLSAGGVPANLVQYRLGEGVGNYLLLISSFLPTSPLGPTIRLSQTGTIPADAAGLTFFGSGYVQVFINGGRVGDSLLPTPVDVATFAGQTVDLEFVVRSGESSRIDIVGFTSVPEPSTLALFGVSLGALLWCGRRR